MFDSLADATRELRDFFDDDHLERVLQALVPTISLRPSTVPDRGIGSTRLGGVPDLPVGAQWPRPPVPLDAEAIASRGNEHAAAEMRAHLQAGLPYAFIAQIDLDEAHALGPAAADLPDRGRLLFFYDLSIGPWESGTRPACVIWDDSPRDRLQPLPMPTDLAAAAEKERHEREAILVQFKKPIPAEPLGTNYGAPAKSISLHLVLCTPDTASLEMGAMSELRDYYSGQRVDAEAAELAEAYSEMREALGGAFPSPGWKRHQVLGSPLPEQDDPRYQAVIVTEFGVEFLDRQEWKRQRDRIEQLAHDWRLLLQVDLADWSGDGLTEGTVYFLIRARDLSDRRFDRVVAVYQQT